MKNRRLFACDFCYYLIIDTSSVAYGATASPGGKPDSAFLFLINQLRKEAAKHKDRKDDQIPYIAHAVLCDAGVDDYSYANKRQNRKNKALEYVKLLFLYHHRHENRNIEGVKGDDRQLGGVEAEIAELA